MLTFFLLGVVSFLVLGHLPVPGFQQVGSSLTNSPVRSSSTPGSAPAATTPAPASLKKSDPVKIRENDVYEVWQRGNREYIRYKPSQLPPIPPDFDENKLMRTHEEAEGLVESYAKMYPIVDDKGEAIKYRPIGRVLTKRAFLFLDHDKILDFQCVR